MPPVKIDDLSPVPFFARFLEGQYAELSPEEMRRLRGGNGTVVTQAAPSDSDMAEVVGPELAWMPSWLPALPLHGRVEDPRLHIPRAYDPTLSF